MEDCWIEVGRAFQHVKHGFFILNFNLELVIPQYQDVVLTLDLRTQASPNCGTDIEMGNAVLKLDPRDNVLIGLQNFRKNELIKARSGY